MATKIRLLNNLTLGIVIFIVVVNTFCTSVALPADQDQVVELGNSYGFLRDNKEGNFQAINVTERGPRPKCNPYSPCTLSKGCGYGCNCKGNPLTCQPFLIFPAQPED